MPHNPTLHLSQLLTSRICHDLIGPVGALNLGVEYLADQSTLTEESLSMLKESSDKASARLVFYRMVFGFLGNDRSLSERDTRHAMITLANQMKITLEWTTPESTIFDGGSDKLRLLLTVFLIVAESLPKGGHIKIHAHADGTMPEITATGQVITIPQDVVSAFSREILCLDEVNPRTVPVFICREIAEEHHLAPSLKRIGDETFQISFFRHQRGLRKPA